MSWSLQLRNGDLVIDRGRLGHVTGVQKLAQDIRCHILESMGTDPLHPDFGSVLDGGTLEDGTEVASIIGETDPEAIRSFVTTELNRILTEHQNKQIERAETDRLRYNKTTLTYGEVLDDAEVNIGMTGDLLVVQIILHSKTGEERRIAIPYTP
jgi:hypothetical protein